jgi:hypothetical protein
VADLVLFKRHVKLDWALAHEAIVRSFATQKLFDEAIGEVRETLRSLLRVERGS